MTGTLHEDVSTFLTVSRYILLRMRNIVGKSYGENQNTHFTLNNFSENRIVYEILSKNIVETEGLQMTSQYGAYTLSAGLASLHARTRTHAHRDQ
jgi:hypothetical protein